MAERLTAKPLHRMGSYKLREKSGANDLSPRGVSADQLEAFWRRIVSSIIGDTEDRDALGPQLDDPTPDVAIRAHRARYAAKIEIKTEESIAALLHTIVAPTAPFLCDWNCAHVGAGATPEQAKRFLDSLDAEIADIRAAHAETKYDHPCYEDQLSELGVFEGWRSGWAKRIETSASEVEATAQP